MRGLKQNSSAKDLLLLLFDPLRMLRRKLLAL
jgi:hypothetical protein